MQRTRARRGSDDSVGWHLFRAAVALLLTAVAFGAVWWLKPSRPSSLPVTGPSIYVYASNPQVDVSVGMTLSAGSPANAQSSTLKVSLHSAADLRSHKRGSGPTPVRPRFDSRAPRGSNC
jgi:hypothetical protein